MASFAGRLLSENAMYGFGRIPIFTTRALPVMRLSAETTVIAAITWLARQKAGGNCLEDAVARPRLKVALRFELNQAVKAPY